VGLTAGAGVILVPEIKFTMHEIWERLMQYQERGKATSIVVAAEGIGDTSTVVNRIKENTPFDVRLTKLGYIQRGGSPTARSRHLASLFGIHAVELLLSGSRKRMVGIMGTKVVNRDLGDMVKRSKVLDKDLYNLAMELAI
jgi:6-phosphofructokinase 1